MTNQQTHTDVKTSDVKTAAGRLPAYARPMRRAGAVLTAAAAGAMAVLTAANVATGQQAPAAYPNALPGQPYPSKTAVGGANPAPTGTTPMTTDATATTPAVPMVQATGGAAATGPATVNAVVHLVAGHSQVITLPGIPSKVSVGDAEIAAVNYMPPSTVMVTGKKGGSTGLITIDEQGHATVTEIVVDPDYSALRRQLAETFPTLRIDVSALNDTIGIRGQAPTALVAEQVLEVAGAYGKVHNFVEVAGGQQIMLHIRFAEVSKSAVRQLGVNFGGTDGVSAITTTAFGGGTNVFSIPAAFGGTEAFSAASFAGIAGVNGVGRFGHTPFDYFITALEENGLVRMLAEPNVVAINGQEGSFVAGGEIPIPISQGGGSGAGAAVTVEYKEYGIKLNYTPLILGNGQIRLKVAPEVSSLDEANAVRANGFDIPAITKRKVSTTVELADGQSLALAGLLSDTSSATTDAIPILGDLPVLGSLFRSTSFQHQQTELVVLVTPHLVGGTNPGQTQPVPGEHWRQPIDAGVYFNHDLGGPMVGRSVEGGLAPGRSGTMPPPATAPTTVTTPPPTFRGSYGFAPATPETTAAAR